MLLYVSVGIVLGMGYLVHGGDKSCPSNISPCYCSSRDLRNDQLTIVCEKMKNVKQLYPVLNNTRGYNVSFFFHGGIGDMPSNLFRGHAAKKIIFYHANVQFFGSRPFSGLEDYLEELDIQGSVHNDLSLPLGHLRKLRDFKYIYNSKVKKLGNEWFSGGPSTLKRVRIFGNNFKEIGDQVFVDLINVEEIRLSDNKFDEISRSMFPRPANKLKNLYIQFNWILHMPKDIFDDMPALKLVSVSGNRLTTLSEAIFGRIWGQLDEISFYNNKGFKCDTRMSWILSRKSEMPTKVNGMCENHKDVKEFLKKEPSDIVDIDSEEHF